MTRVGEATATEDTVDQPEAAPALTRIVMPEAWKERVHPRRGYPSAGWAPVKPSGDKAFAAVRAHYETLREQLLTGGKDDPRVKALEARMAAGGPPSDPAVEAALGVLARYKPSYYAKARPNDVVDYWVAEGSLAFAVDAALRGMDLAVGVDWQVGWDETKRIKIAPIADERNVMSYDAPGFFDAANNARPLLLRLRRLIAAADEVDYNEARAVAAEHREGPFIARVAASYLLPTERAWVAADIACYAKEIESQDIDSDTRCWRPDHLKLLLTCIESWDDFVRMNGREVMPTNPEELWDLPLSPHDILGKNIATNYVPSLLEGAGIGFIPFGTFLAEQSHKRDYAEALAAIDSDEAMGALLDRADDERALAGLTTAVRSFPERAARLIGERVQAKGKHYKKVERLLPKGGEAGQGRGGRGARLSGRGAGQQGKSATAQGRGP